MGEIITAYNEIPYAVLGQDIEASYRQDFFLELGHIVQYYKTYAKGAEFLTEGANGEYVPSNLKFKKVKTLIDKEARFLFSRTPDITVNPTVLTNKTEKEKTTILNDYVSSVITKNNLANQLLKAAKDCFIGKRVAFLLNFSIEYGITVSFLNSLEFFYEYDVAGKLSKFVAFQIVRQHSDSSERRIHKKVYDIGEDGYCYAYENLYNGMGTPIEGYEMPRTRTEFNFVPAYVILNDGLTGDSKG